MATRVIPVILELRRYIGKVRRRLALEATEILKLTNPFQTGHSRNNWIPAMGQATYHVDGSRDHPSKSAQDRGIASLWAEPEESNRVANLTNAVDYVRHLNEGSSRQAGAAYVEAALAQAKVNVRLQIGRLKRAFR